MVFIIAAWKMKYNFVVSDGVTAVMSYSATFPVNDCI